MDLMCEMVPFHAALAGWASRTPGRPALYRADGPPLTYADLDSEVTGLRASLRRLGIGLADRVAFAAGSDPAAAMLSSALRTAAVAAPLPAGMTAPELGDVLPRLGLAAVIAGEDEPIAAVARDAGIPLLMAVPDNGDAFRLRLAGDPIGPPSADGLPQLDDLAIILCTSGSTGRPKLVVRKHRIAVIHQQNVTRQLELTEDCGTVLTSSLSHAQGQHLLGLQVYAGGSLVCPNNHDPASLRVLIDAFPVTHLALPTALLGKLAGNAASEPAVLPDRIRAIRVSSARLDPDLREKVEARFDVPVLDAYACSEAANLAGDFLGRPRRRGSVGLVLTATRIMSGDTPVLPGEPGEIQVRGDTVFDGYLDDPEANAAAFTADGWFRTGDVGWIDGGYLYLAGRAVETINVGGRKVDPLEIEAALAGFPGIAEAAAFAVAAPALGERVGLAVVPQSGAEVNLRALRRHLLARLSPWKTPTLIRQLDALPRTANGKVKRTMLAEVVGHSPPIRRSGGANGAT